MFFLLHLHFDTFWTQRLHKSNYQLRFLFCVEFCFVFTPISFSLSCSFLFSVFCGFLFVSGGGLPYVYVFVCLFLDRAFTALYLLLFCRLFTCLETETGVSMCVCVCVFL